MSAQVLADATRSSLALMAQHQNRFLSRITAAAEAVSVGDAAALREDLLRASVDALHMAGAVLAAAAMVPDSTGDAP